jgi:hypothetical protein
MTRLTDARDQTSGVFVLAFILAQRQSDGTAEREPEFKQEAERRLPCTACCASSFRERWNSEYIYIFWEWMYRTRWIQAFVIGPVVGGSLVLGLAQVFPPGCYEKWKNQNTATSPIQTKQPLPQPHRSSENTSGRADDVQPLGLKAP